LDRNKIIDLIREALISKVKAQAMGHLISKVPLFALPIINPITGLALGYLLRFLIENTLIGANILLIEIDVNADVSNLEKAAKIAREAYLSKKKEAIQKADEDLINAARDVINYGGPVF
jgi:hypothetical protein